MDSGSDMEWVSGESPENEWGGVPYFREKDKTLRQWRQSSRNSGYTRSRPQPGKKAKYAMLAPHIVHDPETGASDVPLSYTDMRAPVSDSGILFYTGKDNPLVLAEEGNTQRLWKGSMSPQSRIPSQKEGYAFAAYVQKFRKGGVVLKATATYAVLKPYSPSPAIGKELNTWSVPLTSQDVTGRGGKYPYRHMGVKLLTKT